MVRELRFLFSEPRAAGVPQRDSFEEQDELSPSEKVWKHRRNRRRKRRPTDEAIADRRQQSVFGRKHG